MFRMRPLLFAAAVALLTAAVTFAQTGGSLTARPDRGASVGGAYSSSGVDSVSLTGGGLNVSIPLASLPPIAGGKLGVTITATYNSKLWDVGREEVLVPGTNPRRTYVVDMPRLSPRGGWRIGGPGYAIVWRNAHEDFDYVQPEQRADTTDTDWPYVEGNREWHKLYLITPDGAEHELVPTEGGTFYNGTERTYLFGTFSDTPDGRPTRYHTVDSTYLSFSFLPDGGWVVTAPDGTTATRSGEGQRIKDTNGNSILIYDGADGAWHYQDVQSGREIRVTGDMATGYQVWYRTVGEDTPEQHVDVNTGATVVRGKFYRVNAWNSSVQAEDGSTTGSQCVRGAILDTGVNGANNPLHMAVVRGIVFPATEPGQPGRQFTFGYNSDASESFTTNYSDTCGVAATPVTVDSSKGLGELSRMQTPTGAVFEYTYSLDGQHLFQLNLDEVTRDMVTIKRVGPEGAAEADKDKWTYDINVLGGGGTVTNPDGTSAAEAAYIQDPGYSTKSGSPNGLGGKVCNSRTGNVLVQRRWRSNPGGLALSAPSGAVAINPLVEAEFTSLIENDVAVRMSAKTYQYDLNGNLLQSKEYDWFDPGVMTRDAAGIPEGNPPDSALLRQTDTSYYNSATDLSSTNLYSKRATSGTTLVINAPRETVTGASVTRFRYDGQAFDHAPTKGNVTQVESFDDQGDADAGNDRWVTTKTTYDQYGNVETATDANGNVTHFTYDANTHAQATKVEVDPGTGLQTTLTTYDFRTGLVTSTTDANGQTTTIDYTNQLLLAPDPFGRPGVVTGPAVTVDGVSRRRTVVTTYEDSLRRVTMESDLRAEGDHLLKSRTTSDELGRTVLTEQSEDGSTYTVSARAAYEQGGKFTFTSSPMRATAAATDGWTRTTRDTTGRVREVTTFAGADKPGANDACDAAAGCTGKVTTDYDAEFVTVTDQAGRTRRSKSDGLGRLVRVDEPVGEPTAQDDKLGSHDSPAQPTAYAYDVLGNLTLVRQGGQLQLQNGQYLYVGGQTRTFTYGSLSRLSSATNPESGKLSYEYDGAGNLKKRTDARGVTTTYGYDGLNRNTTVHYVTTGSGAATTPDVTRSYDGAVLGKGRPWKTETAGTGLVTVERYDELGRPLSQSQQFWTGAAWGTAYNVGYTYDLAGGVKTQTYPSGNSVSYTYDDAGRLSGFAGNLGDGAARTYADSYAYDGAGRMRQERFGTTTALYHKLHYNSRGQLYDIRLSTAPWATDQWNWNRGAILNYYSSNYAREGDPSAPPSPDNNGNLRRQQTWVPADEQTSDSTFTQQTYSYDQLNRLTSVAEAAGVNGAVGADTLRQAYDYDRWGNRTLNAAGTWVGQATAAPSGLVNEAQFEPGDLANTNRLYAPGDLTYPDPADPHRRMRYDGAGNLVFDSYTGAGGRTYDAENRMVSAADKDGGTTAYAYDGDGRRVRRNVGTAAEVWQVYGPGGELLAEYAKEAPANKPQKEYGYRGGELLVTAEAAAAGWGPAPAFEDNPLNPNHPGETPVRAKHITDLRSAIDSLRAHKNRPPYGWSPAPQAGDPISTTPITEMRAALDGALGAPAGGYTAGLASGQPILAKHIQELRKRVLDAWQSGTGGTDILWLVTDQLGTPRMVVDRTGGLAGVTRHDYLPFGEELNAGVGGRAQGYGTGDNVRQQFTGYERDGETGLDYAQARYYSAALGRFTAADDVRNDSVPSDPQSWNKYAYVRNRPLMLIDPTGEKAHVSITTDPDKKTGTMQITASFGVYAANGDVSAADLQDQADQLRDQIVATYTGKYVENGITFTVSVNVDVQVLDRNTAETMANDGKLDNLVSIVNAERLIGEDGKPAVAWAYNNAGEDFDRMTVALKGHLANDNLYTHEFGHTLGTGHPPFDATGHLGPGNVMQPVYAEGRTTLSRQDFSGLFGPAVREHMNRNERARMSFGARWPRMTTTHILQF